MAPFSACNKPQPVIDLEHVMMQSLWRMVIMQAMYDIRTKDVKSTRGLDRDRAASWFDNSRDFNMVCDLAGWEPAYVMRMLGKAKEINFQFELPGGQGWRTMQRMKQKQLEGAA